MHGSGLHVLQSRIFSRGNPLVRPIDRIEARCIPVLVLIALVTLPVALTVGSSMGHSQLRIAELQQQSRVQVTAITEEAAPPATAVARGFEPVVPPRVPATWVTPWGTEASGLVDVPSGTPVGSRVSIWLDDATGAVVPRPMDATQAVNTGVITGLTFWLISLAAVFGIYALIHGLANRRRFAQWEQELKAAIG
ncbi:hypothetical protein ONR57_06550 [Hoyosella sp. YIM 151337]|uniref:Rv1733c family protein n=1 Tax=Hoyosella sp. YIM 151337 TaxID=2992742 RepID=UPI0022365B83|nr:hypothetical protein [Hoyosella sp. YIM 151337]MCW4352952.1 hypothetical protein [Hoyosella sp. YIM 151337]